jgi:hypothetical protein
LWCFFFVAGAAAGAGGGASGMMVAVASFAQPRHWPETCSIDR